MQSKLGELFESRCPKDISSPKQTAEHYTFEGSNPKRHTGTVVDNIVSFCGSQCIKNPSQLYQKGNDEAGLSLNSATKVRKIYLKFV